MTVLPSGFVSVRMMILLVVLVKLVVSFYDRNSTYVMKVLPILMPRENVWCYNHKHSFPGRQFTDNPQRVEHRLIIRTPSFNI